MARSTDIAYTKTGAKVTASAEVIKAGLESGDLRKTQPSKTEDAKAPESAKK